MGDVSVTLQVMPEGAEVDLDELSEEVKKIIDVESIEHEPVAFGLKSLKVRTIIPDAAGGTDDIEEKISDLEEVQNVKVTDLRRLL